MKFVKHKHDGVVFWEYNHEKTQTILMIHGFRGTHHGLEDIAKNLPGYRILIPDLPGFGESKAFKDGHSLDHYVAFLRDFCQENTPDVILGHSFGTILASHFAAEYPVLVKKLILINPISAPALRGPKAVMTQAAKAYYWLSDKAPEKIGNRILSSQRVIDIMSHGLTVSKNEQLREHIKDQHRAHFSTFADRRSVNEAFVTSVSHTTAEVAGNLIMPTLVIGAQKDQISHVKTQRAFAESLPDGHYREIAHVGHLTHYEKPKEVAVAIRAFLNR